MADIKEQITELWNSGKSAKEIGNIVGKSRNSIVGIVFRLGLTRRKRAAIVQLKPKGEKMEEVKEEKKSSKNVPFMKLEFHHCRWPVGRGKDGLVTFCGVRKESELKPYCIKHNMLARGGAKNEKLA